MAPGSMCKVIPGVSQGLGSVSGSGDMGEFLGY